MATSSVNQSAIIINNSRKQKIKNALLHKSYTLTDFLAYLERMNNQQAVRMSETTRQSILDFLGVGADAEVGTDDDDDDNESKTLNKTKQVTHDQLLNFVKELVKQDAISAEIKVKIDEKAVAEFHEVLKTHVWNCRGGDNIVSFTDSLINIMVDSGIRSEGLYIKYKLKQAFYCGELIYLEFLVKELNEYDRCLKPNSELEKMSFEEFIHYCHQLGDDEPCQVWKKCLTPYQDYSYSEYYKPVSARLLISLEKYPNDVKTLFKDIVCGLTKDTFIWFVPRGTKLYANNQSIITADDATPGRYVRAITIGDISDDDDDEVDDSVDINNVENKVDAICFDSDDETSDANTSDNKVANVDTRAVTTCHDDGNTSSCDILMPSTIDNVDADANRIDIRPAHLLKFRGSHIK